MTAAPTEAEREAEALPPDAADICMCGDRIGSGGWTCRHGGCCVSMEDDYRDQERGEHREGSDHG